MVAPMSVWKFYVKSLPLAPMGVNILYVICILWCFARCSSFATLTLTCFCPKKGNLALFWPEITVVIWCIWCFFRYKVLINYYSKSVCGILYCISNCYDFLYNFFLMLTVISIYEIKFVFVTQNLKIFLFQHRDDS